MSRAAAMPRHRSSAGRSGPGHAKAPDRGHRAEASEAPVSGGPGQEVRQRPDPAVRAPARPRVCVAAITGAHGVRGLVKVKSFTDDPLAFADYGPLEDDGGRRRFDLAVKSSVKGQFLAEIAGVSDRDAAAALAGTTLWVDRDRLPPPDEDEDEFYHADLIGLPVVLADGTPLGTVRALYDFGAGDVMEIARPGTAPVVVPFTKAAVPVVDIAQGRVVVDPPAGLMDRGRTGAGSDDAEPVGSED